MVNTNLKMMAKVFGSGGGYTVWSVLRTIREAENIARWNPWLAHDWMEEARDRLDIYSAPYHEEYDAAVNRINDLFGNQTLNVTGMMLKSFGKKEKCPTHLKCWKRFLTN